uniref:Uncharacterized protein n=1 Tax=Anguilla anguilla TaxID=7936 RepID=A0A0E9S553_ANGAN
MRRLFFNFRLQDNSVFHSTEFVQKIPNLSFKTTSNVYGVSMGHLYQNLFY